MEKFMQVQQFIQIDESFINQGDGGIVRIYLAERDVYDNNNIVKGHVPTIRVVTKDVEKDYSYDGQIYARNHYDEYDLNSTEARAILNYLSGITQVLVPFTRFHLLCVECRDETINLEMYCPDCLLAQK